MDVLVVAAIVSIALNPLLFRALVAFEARQRRREPQPQPAQPVQAETGEATYPVLVTGLGELGQRLIRRCLDTGVPVCAVGSDAEQIEQLRHAHAKGHRMTSVWGDPAQPEVLRAAGLSEARIIVVTDPSLPEKMRICIAAREVNPRVAIIATAQGAADRAWLQEFGAVYICDALDEMTAALLRSVRSGL
jgi:CPA2 family monovalent cation:H+ antiporter-2